MSTLASCFDLSSNLAAILVPQCIINTNAVTTSRPLTGVIIVPQHYGQEKCWFQTKDVDEAFDENWWITNPGPGISTGVFHIYVLLTLIVVFLLMLKGGVVC